MKRGMVVIAAVFAVALAVVIGTRMSADAMAVVVGVACGVLASIPTSLLLIWVLAGRRAPGNATGNSVQAQGGSYPPVVVVNPGPGYGMPGYGPPALSSTDPNMALPGGRRTFKVVGEEETLLDNAAPLFPGLADDWSGRH